MYVTNQQPSDGGGLRRSSVHWLPSFKLTHLHPFNALTHSSHVFCRCCKSYLTFAGALVDGGDGGDADNQEVIVTFVTNMTTSDMSGEEDEGTEGSSSSLLSLPSML